MNHVLVTFDARTKLRAESMVLRRNRGLC